MESERERAGASSHACMCVCAWLGSSGRHSKFDGNRGSADRRFTRVVCLVFSFSLFFGGGRRGVVCLFACFSHTLVPDFQMSCVHQHGHSAWRMTAAVAVAVAVAVAAVLVVCGTRRRLTKHHPLSPLSVSKHT